MLLPIAILAGLVVVARVITKSPENPLIKIGGTHSGRGGEHHHHHNRVGRFASVFETQGEWDLPPNISLVADLIRSGREPDAWLIDAAIGEAYNAGRWDVVDSLSRRFLSRESQDLIQESVESTDGPNQSDTIGIVIGKNSPFDGVSNDDWNRFVDRLSTQPPDFDSAKHVGRFYHSKDRLRALGVDDVGNDPEKQYDALSKDLQDYQTQCRDLIDEFNCHPINVNGTDLVITTSGLLTLLKAAGPIKARSWLTNDGDRTQFPKTTEMFLQTNGIF